jgi:hypothetical protein
MSKVGTSSGLPQMDSTVKGLEIAEINGKDLNILIGNIRK